MTKFKPQLLPNDKAGVTIDWESRIADPKEWLLSYKYDGARIEIVEGELVKGRSLKVIPNVHIQKMADQFQNHFYHQGVMEAEFWAPGMTFSEIMHFFKTEDITSEKTYAKYRKLWEKTGGDPAKGWKYPGRSVEWLTTWHPHLRFHIFDWLVDEEETKHTRYKNLCSRSAKMGLPENARIIYQHVPESMKEILQRYEHAVGTGGEGLVLMKQNSLYKYGRKTLNQGDAFKIKDTNKDYEGIIIDVEESTVAREGSEKTINELGRSVTSKLKEDRLPSGMAKGFKIKMDDGKTLSISLNGYNHADRKALLYGKRDWLGMRIKFTGAPPVKSDGVPRHAHYTKGNLR